MKLNQIRQLFLKFFSQKYGHLQVESSPLIPHNDPTLLFTNSGMVQFKNCFTQLEVPTSNRITTAQKCLRAGGKHNDLENVGYTARHHTFFEMLGNFSFGDYFKDLAIEMAWKFITEELGINKEKLYITIYHEDHEAEELWKKIAGLDASRIIKINTADNFWSMGNSGPCGPCSEIFYDHGDKYWGGLPGTPEQDGDRFVEIWNLVFMQYEQFESGERVFLPKKSIDTGMGLERVAAVMQGVNDNYSTDTLQAIISASVLLSGDNNPFSSSHKVIADHMRAACFMIADGILPSNEGRGYVLRRILRRAIRHVHHTGSKDLLLHRLVGIVIEEMSEQYPELIRSKAAITSALYDEEDKFRDVLARGMGILYKYLEGKNSSQEEKINSGGDSVITNNPNNNITNTNDDLIIELFPGSEAFRLYDTFGFPVDMIDDILKSHNMKVDMSAFEQEMEQQRQRSKANWIGSGENKQSAIWFDIITQHGKSEFIGYNQIRTEKSKIVALINAFGESVDAIKMGENSCWVVLDRTPFYAESGGQVGDTGEIAFTEEEVLPLIDTEITKHNNVGNGKSCTEKKEGSHDINSVEKSDDFGHKKMVIRVCDTQKYADGIIAHKVSSVPFAITCGMEVAAHVDEARRLKICANHSAAHLVHHALRQILGEHVMQKGSLVNEEKMRFDFSHNKSLTLEEINKVEEVANAMIIKNKKTNVEHMEQKEAIKRNIIALFGEKYSEIVRTVTMSESAELCGGTHVNRTGDIGLIRIISEESIASGVRRIEALTGLAAVKYTQQQSHDLQLIAKKIPCAAKEVVEKTEKLIEECRSYRNELSKIKLDLISKTAEKTSVISKNGEKIGEIYNCNAASINDLRELAKKEVNSMIMMAPDIVNKQSINIMIKFSPADIKKNSQLSAKTLAQKLMEKYGGSGGGNEQMAQIGNVLCEGEGEPNISYRHESSNFSEQGKIIGNLGISDLRKIKIRAKIEELISEIESYFADNC